MLTDVLWLIAGSAITGYWLIYSGPNRYYYVIDTVVIFNEALGKLTDIDLIAGGGDGMRLLYDVVPNGRGYFVRQKGQGRNFATKNLDVFDSHAAAKQRFDKIDGLFLEADAQGRAAHRIFLWTVMARNRAAVPSLLLKRNGDPRKLAETDYRALLALYHQLPPKVVENG